MAALSAYAPIKPKANKGTNTQTPEDIYKKKYNISLRLQKLRVPSPTGVESINEYKLNTTILQNMIDLHKQLSIKLNQTYKATTKERSNKIKEYKKDLKTLIELLNSIIRQIGQLKENFINLDLTMRLADNTANDILIKEIETENEKGTKSIRGITI